MEPLVDIIEHVEAAEEESDFEEVDEAEEGEEGLSRFADPPWSSIFMMAFFVELVHI
jgi:hypothetical protein